MNRSFVDRDMFMRYMGCGIGHLNLNHAPPGDDDLSSTLDDAYINHAEAFDDESMSPLGFNEGGLCNESESESDGEYTDGSGSETDDSLDSDGDDYNYSF